MTPREFNLTVKGYNRNREHEQRLVAWQTAYILNLFTEKGKQITIEDLLPEKREHKKQQTVEEQIRVMEMWVTALGGTDTRG